MSGTTRLNRIVINQLIRGPGMRTFGEDVFEQFLQVNGLERMVRGHSVVEGGRVGGLGEGCCRCSLRRVMVEGEIWGCGGCERWGGGYF
ncbi:MAG: hypothetical protein U9N13_09175 [Euryarchaeota archaeon]|nr:hypothetical protein [Euryarchaeota archaeon]